MASEASSKDPNQHDPSDDPKPIRKRTKTGCLTCRKRRIKCGEQRPVCQNCVKSRRVCEYGYSGFPRHLPYGASYLGSESASPSAQPAVNPGPGQPAYTWSNQQPYPQHPSQFPVNPPAALEYQSWPYDSRSAFPSPGPPYPQDNTAGFPPEATASNFSNYLPENPAYQFDPAFPPDPDQYDQAAGAYNPPQSFSANGPYQQHDVDAAEYEGPFGPRGLLPLFAPELEFPLTSGSQQRSATAQPQGRQITYNPHLSPPTNSSSYQDVDNPPPGEIYDIPNNSLFAEGYIEPTEVSDIAQVNRSTVLESAAVETADDDYYDVDSGDERDVLRLRGSARLSPNDVQAWQCFQLVALGRDRFENTEDWAPVGDLDTYRPEQVANPLRNPATAKVFANFVCMTMHMLSTSDRALLSPTTALQVHPVVAKRGLSLMKYVVPSMALHDQAVLHALLALSSAQIAVLQKQTITPSRKHYAWALRRVRHSLKQQPRSNQIMCLVAVLLLLHYDVNTSDLIKWLSNMRIAKNLLMEVDFETRNRRCYRSSSQLHSRDSLNPSPNYRSALDVKLVEQLAGHPVNYRAYSELDEPPAAARPSQSEMDEYHTLQDLHWWYLKEDVSQSVLFAVPTLMDFKAWTRCPPRAAIGIPGAVYGAWDHHTLLLGRVVNFRARDLPRKHIMNKMSDKPWPDFPFDGFGPDPQVFMAPEDGRSGLNEPAVSDLSAATNRAVDEWRSQIRAWDAMEERLMAAYPPLPPSACQPIPTAWGPALCYASAEIGCLWAWFYTSRLILERSHPINSPPAYYQSVQACAAGTAWRSREIARMMAGVAALPADSYDDTRSAALHDGIGALFHAALQFTDPAQRAAVIDMMRDVEHNQGQLSAGLIISGCETVWETMPGPPYARIREVRDLLSDAYGVRLGEEQARATPESARVTEKLRNLSLSPPASSQTITGFVLLT